MPGNEFLKAHKIFHGSINDCDRVSAPRFFFSLKTSFQNQYIQISSELMQSEETVRRKAEAVQVHLLSLDTRTSQS